MDKTLANEVEAGVVSSSSQRDQKSLIKGSFFI